MIVGQMALCKFPMWQMCLDDLLKYCDRLYLRFDKINGDWKKMSHYNSEKYYDDPFDSGEIDWSKKDDEGYWANLMGDNY